MTEQTRKSVLKTLEIIERKMDIKEDNVRGGLYMFGVGVAGMAYGVLSKSDSSLISGLIVSSGSLLFRAINNMSLNNLRVQQYLYRYALKYDNVDEYHSDGKDGKQFKR